MCVSVCKLCVRAPVCAHVRACGCVFVMCFAIVHVVHVMGVGVCVCARACVCVLCRALCVYVVFVCVAQPARPRTGAGRSKVVRS